MKALGFARPMVALIGAVACLLAASLAGPSAAQAPQPVQFVDASGQTIEAAVWTPAAATPAPWPLVVISHGNGGGYTGHHDTAEALAKAGFVVAALNHPGDNYRDMSRSLRLTDRAPQVSALISYMVEDSAQAAAIDPDRIGAFGFSAGGFTVLSLAGGHSDPQAILDHCAAHPAFFVCTLIAPEGLDIPNWRPEAYDPRVKAIVAAAPGFGFAFSDESLRGVHIPVQLWQAAGDQVLPEPFHVEPVRDRLPGGADYHLVAGAGHLDFLAPCDPGMSAAAPDLCRSSPGFDRAGFKAEFNRAVVDFFSRALADPGRPHP